MPNSSCFLAFLVPFLLLSSSLLLFLFKDFFFAIEKTPTEPNYDDVLNNEDDDLISFENDSDIFLPIIIDGKNITAVMSPVHLMFQEAVDFCKEKNMTLPEKPFEVQSLQDFERG